MMGVRVLAAWAAPASGPGWANQPVRYVYSDDSKNLQEDWIQPDDQNYDLYHLYEISSAVNSAMVRAVEKKLAADKLKSKSKKQ